MDLLITFSTETSVVDIKICAQNDHGEMHLRKK